MALASLPGVDAPVTSWLFGQAARATRSTTGESGRVDSQRMSCTRRRDGAVSPESLGETGEGLQRHRRVDEHGYRLRAVRRSPVSLGMGDGGKARTTQNIFEIHPTNIAKNCETFSTRSSRTREFKCSSRATKLEICFFRRALILCLSENFHARRKRTFRPWSVSGGCFFLPRFPEGAQNQSPEEYNSPLVVS